jgi:hypothetical protein
VIEPKETNHTPSIDLEPVSQDFIGNWIYFIFPGSNENTKLNNPKPEEELI